jgi:two-component system, LytTR family, sensor kinase
MSQNRLYWICQIFGWGAHFLNQILLYTISYNFDNQLLANAFVNFVIAILMTHGFKIIFLKYEWIKLPIPRLVLRNLVCIFIMTNLLVAINIPLDAKYTYEAVKENPILTLQYFISLAEPLLIWFLIYTFYHYIDILKSREIEKMQLTASINAAEAKVLRAQMNPHFVFNALNSIRALIVEDPDRAKLGITQLSSLLRSSLLADRQTTISLKEEIKTMEDYLALEKVRYEERLQVKWKIQPETLAIQIPPMMLQTLVENAIKHGVQKALRWGFVEIQTQLIESQLVIIIRNTGKLKSTESKSSGFGLKNTQQRIKLLYGDKASFQIYQETDTEVTAKIILPTV